MDGRVQPALVAARWVTPVRIASVAVAAVLALIVSSRLLQRLSVLRQLQIHHANHRPDERAGAAAGKQSSALQASALLAHLNRVLRRAGIGGFATCLCADVASNGVVTMANAGHLPPYCRGEEIAVESGLPLGIADGAYSGYEQSRILLGNDDTLTFLTDGVAEARDAQGGLFGFERTAAISARPAEEVARAALAFGQEDDITVLTVKRLGTAAGIETLASTLVETSLRAQFENETS